MSHKNIEELRDDLLAASNIVVVGANYVHSKTGRIYIVNGFTVLESSDEVAVRYSPHDALDIEFSRPLSEFVEIISLNSDMLPRFARQTI